MKKHDQQIFDEPREEAWIDFDGLDGVQFIPLAEPVPNGSIHKAKIKQGTKIFPHTHPAPEYVYVISGRISTGGHECSAGTFWFVPAHLRQGPHIAITDCEILTIRLGALGEFEVSDC